MLLGAAAPAAAQSTTAPYPAPKSLDVFLMADRNAEVALAKSAAPASISDSAEVLVLGPHGFETAVKGTNGFVCLVDRGWAKPFDDPEFWNPKVRSPMCDNAVAARTVMPIFTERARWIMDGASIADVADRTRAEIAAKTLPVPATGAVSYMMSKDGYIADSAAPHWHPHIMFYLPLTDAADWGADAKGSQVLHTSDEGIAMTTVFILLPKWSDGSTGIMEMSH